MLSKIIKLEYAMNDYLNKDVYSGMDGKDALNIAFYMQFTIEAFKTLTDEVVRLKAKVKKLEQQNSYYPATQEEINNIKEVRNING